MTNPLRGVYLDNKYFNYVADSFRETIGLRNDFKDTIGPSNARTFTVGGANMKEFVLELSLDNTYYVKNGSVEVGSTTWLGLSRLTDLVNVCGAVGASMPLVFVTPYGVTYNVVPIGSLDVSSFIPENPDPVSMEFRVTLTLEEA